MAVPKHKERSTISGDGGGLHAPDQMDLSGRWVPLATKVTYGGYVVQVGEVGEVGDGLEERRTSRPVIAISQSNATVTRVVGNELVYVMTEANVPLVFVPDKIEGYKGEPLKVLGIKEGSKVIVTMDKSRHLVLLVQDPNFTH